MKTPEKTRIGEKILPKASVWLNVSSVKVYQFYLIFILRFCQFSVDRAPFLRYTYFCICDVRGSIAQLGEHLPYKQGVTGSSPVVPTKSLQWPGSTVG